MSAPNPASSPPTLPSTPAVSRNPAFELAIERHIDKLPAREKEAFRTCATSIDERDLLARARAHNAEHARYSSLRPQAGRLFQVLGLLDRFIGGVTIAI